MKLTKDTKIAIVGLGLLGGSYALALSKKGYHVIGVARRQETIDYAFEHNLIKEGSTDTSIIASADIIICCLYPTVMFTWIEDNKHLFKENAIISDISGVKQEVVYKVQTMLQNQSNEFISTHPMAGRETSGIEYANTEMFEKANFIVVPTENNSKEAISCMNELASILGFAHISVLTPKEHDEMIAFVSQLTHVIAVSLMNTHDNEHLVDYTGDSFRDLTRIASINENMWSELFLLNKESLLHEITAFQTSLEDFKQTLIDEDIDKMKSLFIQSTSRRMKFNKK